MNHSDPSRIENPVIYVPIRHTSTFVENPLQIDLFMQNKPKVKNAKINVSSFITSKYVKLDTWWNQKNKPNSNPIKPNLKRAQMNVNLTLTKDYRKNDDFVVRINKPNLVRRRRIPKMNANLYIIKDYRKNDCFASQKDKPKTKPIQTLPWA